MLVQHTAVIVNGYGPANMKNPPSVGTMVAQRRRRWANIVPTPGERLVFSGYDLTRCLPDSGQTRFG